MNAKEYKFIVSFCGGWCGGTLSFYAEDEDKAYEKAMDHVVGKLIEAFPELDIEYNVELFEEDSKETNNGKCCGTCWGWEQENSIQNCGVCIRYAGVTRKDDYCDHWHRDW